MSDRLGSAALRGLGAGVASLEQLVYLPIGTNGYVSTWGLIMSVYPPKGC